MSQMNIFLSCESERVKKGVGGSRGVGVRWRAKKTLILIFHSTADVKLALHS